MIYVLFILMDLKTIIRFKCDMSGVNGFAVYAA